MMFCCAPRRLEIDPKKPIFSFCRLAHLYSVYLPPAAHTSYPSIFSKLSVQSSSPAKKYSQPPRAITFAFIFIHRAGKFHRPFLILLRLALLTVLVLLLVLLPIDVVLIPFLVAFPVGVLLLIAIL